MEERQLSLSWLPLFPLFSLLPLPHKIVPLQPGPVSSLKLIFSGNAFTGIPTGVLTVC